MIDQAIEKINAEMQKDPANRYMEIIGHYIIDRCDEVLAAKIADGKTLKDAMESVVRVARKRQRGNVATLTPDEVFGEVDKFFGLSTDTAAQWKAMGFPVVVPAAPAEAPVQRVSVDVDLDSFLTGGAP